MVIMQFEIRGVRYGDENEVSITFIFTLNVNSYIFYFSIRPKKLWLAMNDAINAITNCIIVASLIA